MSKIMVLGVPTSRDGVAEAHERVFSVGIAPPSIDRRGDRGWHRKASRREAPVVGGGVRTGGCGILGNGVLSARGEVMVTSGAFTSSSDF